MTAIEPRANPDLLGQDRALAILREAWHGDRLPHAWLIHGPRGVGKATLAFRAARALLAGSAATDARLEVPEDRPVFRQVASGAHPDLRVLEPPRDAKAARSRSEIPVDAVRAVTTALHGTAAMGGYKVVVVDGAEQLNRNAANALLKPLEEPPPRTVLLLVSHRPSRLMATIRSRCAMLRLAPLADAEVAAILDRQAPDLEAAERAALARLARGSPGRALDLAARRSLELYRRLTEALAADPPDALALHDLAAELARHAESHGMEAPVGLLQELLGRVAAVALARPDAPIFAGEDDALGRLAARSPLDRWSRLWEKVARIAARTEAVNLDRFQVFLHVLTLMAPASGQADEGPPDGAPLGGRYALG